MSRRQVAGTREGLSMVKKKRTRRTAALSAPRDLSAGVIVVVSGGPFDLTNPPEIRDRMDQYIADVNADPYVHANTGGNGLTFKLLQNQQFPHLHQTKWRQVCAALNLLAATPLILVGHSNGGAAAVDLARCLQSQAKTVDLLFTADSVLTLDDIGDVNKVPANVKLNFNSYVIPTPAWLLAPFPIGTRNRRQADDSLDGILNIGLTYNLPGALAHRNAFYELAGGDTASGEGFTLPHLLLDVTLAELRGETNFDIINNAETPLQKLATQSRVVIELETTTFKKTLRP
jgi:pimeloyl-ACP methyl ester carboxylesterase